MDEIITEVRKIREAYAAEHNYNLKEMFADLKKKEASSNKQLVDLRRKHQKKEKQQPFPPKIAAGKVTQADL